MMGQVSGVRGLVSGVFLVCFAYAAKAQAHDHTAAAPDTMDHRAMAAAEEAMAGPMHGEGLHMRMSPARRATGRDSARAAQRVIELRTAIARYRDVRVAEADGYRVFLPDLPQSVYHFTNWMYGVESALRFDPAKPPSLLYRRTAQGGYELVGAMYTARAGISLDDLDQRVPLGIARWHQHVNWCLPPRGEASRWTETDAGTPRFGPQSPIATKAACDAVGGRFAPRLFGWMVHATLFEGDDPATIWGGDEHAGH